MEADTLTLIWTMIIGFGVFMYVLMDGFDLGIGILFPFAPSDTDRDIMMLSVAPIWDFNETWLILGGAGLFAAFPLAYATVLPALYIPLLLMLVALIFRGVAFEFRFKARTSRPIWNRSFNLGSLLATFAQGLVLGGLIQGIAIEGRVFVGGMWDWLTPFSVLCGAALVAGYALLGATWMIWRSSGGLQEWSRFVARRLVVAVVIFMAVVSLWTPYISPAVAARWFDWPNILYLSPLPIAALIAAIAVSMTARRREAAPFVLSMVLFLTGYGGLAVSLWPVLIPPDVTIWQAASPPETQIFLLVGMVVLLPVILLYTAYSYWVFRGKVTGESAGYH